MLVHLDLFTMFQIDLSFILYVFPDQLLECSGLLWPCWRWLELQIGNYQINYELKFRSILCNIGLCSKSLWRTFPRQVKSLKIYSCNLYLVIGFKWHFIMRLCSYGGLMAKPGTTSAGEIHLTVTGLVIICMYCTLSGLGGVYSEFVLKKKYEVISVCWYTRTRKYLMSRFGEQICRTYYLVGRNFSVKNLF